MLLLTFAARREGGQIIIKPTILLVMMSTCVQSVMLFIVVSHTMSWRCCASVLFQHHIVYQLWIHVGSFVYKTKKAYIISKVKRKDRNSATLQKKTGLPFFKVHVICFRKRFYITSRSKTNYSLCIKHEFYSSTSPPRVLLISLLRGICVLNSNRVGQTVQELKLDWTDGRK